MDLKRFYNGPKQASYEPEDVSYGLKKVSNGPDVSYGSKRPLMDLKRFYMDRNRPLMNQKNSLMDLNRPLMNQKRSQRH